VSGRILVTRPASQSDGLAGLLRDRGLAPVVVPTVAIDAASGAGALDTMLATLDGAGWVIVTSPNGAAALTARLNGNGARLPAGIHVAAVGPATAAVLRAARILVDHVPDAYRTVAIADGLGDLRGRRVVLARADAATDDLRDALLERGALVEEVVAYRTIEGPAISRDPLHAALHADLAGLAFTSSSTVRGLLRLASPVDRGRARAVPAFCIGPVTAETARQFGFDVAAVADDHTADGLADAIAAHFSPEDR
jgi:uroporphyrinogen III methyltransferase / synthase